MSIKTDQITKSFGSQQILKDINIEVQTGEMVSVVGRSGSGKSTLLYILSSLDRPTTGQVIIDNESIHQLDSFQLHRFRNLKMGFVFQFHHLLPELSALENVLMPAMKLKLQVQKKKFAMDLLDEFGIANKADSFPSQLSGGEQQRVSIARALVMEPKYLFADEPTGNLDSTNGQLVMDLFVRINKERGTTVIYVTHDHQFSLMASRQIYLADGQVVSHL